jgi:hypothetical protein
MARILISDIAAILKDMNWRPASKAFAKEAAKRGLIDRTNNKEKKQK